MHAIERDEEASIMALIDGGVDPNHESKVSAGVGFGKGECGSKGDNDQSVESKGQR